MLKSVTRRALRHMGLEIQRAENAHTEHVAIRRALRAAQADVLLDVGANFGQFAASARDAGFHGRIVSFEALPDVHAELTKIAASDAAWFVAPCAALGSAAGTAEINVAGNSASSSLLPMLPRHINAAPESAYVKRLRVPVARLDAACESLAPPPASLYLKIDTQGFEREVLHGATGILDRVAILQLELSLAPLYENAPTFVEMVQWVQAIGFEFFDIVPGFNDRKSGRLLQVDGFFINSRFV